MYGMEECNSVSTPIHVNVKMDSYANSNKYDAKEYQELMGRLMFLSVNTKPDIAYTLPTQPVTYPNIIMMRKRYT